MESSFFQTLFLDLHRFVDKPEAESVREIARSRVEPGIKHLSRLHLLLTYLNDNMRSSDHLALSPFYPAIQNYSSTV